MTEPQITSVIIAVILEDHAKPSSWYPPSSHQGDGGNGAGKERCENRARIDADDAALAVVA